MQTKKPSIITTTILTLVTLIAFAANSILCRMSLSTSLIDPTSFTSIRLLSGALTLLLLLKFTHKEKITLKNNDLNITASLMLFLYATSFSFAYITLDTGTGALILFGTVQITIILISILKGQKLHLAEWFGILLAFSGLIYLMLPSSSTPSLYGFILMTISGVSWGIYTIRGKVSINPLRDSTYNFILTMPLTVILIIISYFTLDMSISKEGMVLAILSGSIASGIGYTIWYTALKGLSNTIAAAVQLLVPVIAGIGGVLFISEELTQRLMVSSILILGGILTVILGKHLLSK